MVRRPLVKLAENNGLTKENPASGPTEKSDVVVPMAGSGPLVEVLVKRSVPVIVPLIAIEMSCKVPGPLNLGQRMAAPVSSVGPLTVPQFTTSACAGLATTNSRPMATTTVHRV